MTKKLFFLIILITFTLSVEAQRFPFQAWHQGKVVLMNGDTLRGLVKYNLEGNVVQLDNNGQVKAFSSQQILYYEITDQILEGFRYFYSLPHYVRPNYKTPILFEVLYEGQLTLLAREFIMEESVPMYSYYYRTTFATRTRLAFDFYFLNQKGEIEKYDLKKNDLLEILKKKDEEVQRFMKKNNLKHDRREDLVRIVAYYNSLL